MRRISAFFALHPAVGYLVDPISVHAAVDCGSGERRTVVSYLRVVAGVRGRLWPAAATQLVYRVAFSYAFFFEGITGLTVTIGAVLTPFVLMQMTARVNWADLVARPAARPVV